jgi:hypothetical protein
VNKFLREPVEVNNNNNNKRKKKKARKIATF